MEKLKRNNIKMELLNGSIILVTVIVTIGISWILYRHTVNLLTQNLRERLEAIVTTASVQFDTDELEKLNNEEDWKKPEWKKVVKQLIKIRETNDDIVFAYILRKNSINPDVMEFIADSHSFNPYAKIDLDQNGVIDDADSLNWPGQIYEDVPQEAFEGYEKVISNKELYEDQWGALISGYAPIKDTNGQTKGVMVVDMRANDFSAITQQTFLPFSIFIGVLVIIILIQIGILIHIWGKRVEFIAELDRQKDELLGIVSHQLATPITSFKWNTEMMLDGDMGKLTKEQTKHVKSMQLIAENLSDLVDMILDVSRIQLGRMKIEKQSLDLNTFFAEILSVIEPKTIEKKVNFVKTMPKTLPKAMLDSRYTRMTLENLLSNAVKYTPKDGKVQLEVRIADDKLFVRVSDTGMGIPKAEQDKIFGKLFRASNVRNTVDGNGFGLYVAKGAVEAQGGTISFESTEGKGTTFNVMLPLK